LFIDIELFGQLATDLPRRQSVEFQQPLTVGEITRLLGIAVGQVGLATIAGRQGNFKDKVQTDCRLCFFPYIQGGKMRKTACPYIKPGQD